ncbi:hypothetical protein PoB_001972000 [Plakobranchus ocellatus]|uniref:Uncharacterized protein n=1 Tax=Plakobranchus ocellatus TaxID=259542 RepID=A0AAV3ZCA9_9GAST|nr:hypothetical protein PoB_001972000 [Plakobranchus ocellatus]
MAGCCIGYPLLWTHITFKTNLVQEKSSHGAHIHCTCSADNAKANPTKQLKNADNVRHPGVIPTKQLKNADDVRHPVVDHLLVLPSL